MRAERARAGELASSLRRAHGRSRLQTLARSRSDPAEKRLLPAAELVVGRVGFDGADSIAGDMRVLFDNLDAEEAAALEQSGYARGPAACERVQDRAAWRANAHELLHH